MGEGASRLSEEQRKDKHIPYSYASLSKGTEPRKKGKRAWLGIAYQLQTLEGCTLQTPPHNIQAAQALLLHQRDFPAGHSPTSPYPVLTVRRPWIYVSM